MSVKLTAFDNCSFTSVLRVQHGTWRSLVARTLGVREVAGSNPVVPTISSESDKLPVCRCFPEEALGEGNDKLKSLSDFDRLKAFFPVTASLFHYSNHNLRVKRPVHGALVRDLSQPCTLFVS